jgi:hypothetical protein
MWCGVVIFRTISENNTTKQQLTVNNQQSTITKIPIQNNQQQIQIIQTTKQHYETHTII